VKEAIELNLDARGDDSSVPELVAAKKVNV
jgi:hypothetical protein